MSSQNEAVFRFLITTDNHLGYKHNDHIRGEDSFSAFAEALEVARSRDVDFILLGGDLFHTSRPSPSVEHKCIQIIRHHMTADRPRNTSFRRVGGQFCHFEEVNYPNFEDPHLTVPYPIMTIHGNHDDLTGPHNQSVCEKLASSGLINYFGLPTRTKSEMTVEPIVLQKGDIKIALYGMGFMSDQKLKEAFEKKAVTFVKPPSDTYNILVVHQNRVPFSENKHIPDSMYPSFIHLLIRGHEHCSQVPEQLPSSTVNGLVYQPGSTVATSISIGESGAKMVAVFDIKIANPSGDPAHMFQTEYELFELKTSRKMLFKDVTQKEIFKYIKKKCDIRAMAPAQYRELSARYVEECMKDLLKNYNPQLLNTEGPQAAKRMRHDDSKLILPLMRIRMEFVNKLERFDTLEISGRFYQKSVANSDIILFKKQKLETKDDGKVENVTFSTDYQDTEEIDGFEFVDLSHDRRDTIEGALKEYFLDRPKSEQLQVLSIDEYIEAIRSSSVEGNVISKVVKAKKQDVYLMYLAELSDEKQARLKFHDAKFVENWLLSAFDNKVPAMGGDQMEVVTISD